MLSRQDIEHKIKLLKPELSSKFHVRRIGYFGSFATGNQNEQSDLDLLVEFSEPIGWNFFSLEKYLENSFGIPIDLVTENSLKERIKTSILKQVQFV
jgi:predicted nucleotidyltransferase